jgi:hypothetical protein
MTKAEEKAAELYPYAATGTIHWAQQVLKQEGFIDGANWQASKNRDMKAVNTSKVNRVEVIDENGRSYVNWKPTNMVSVRLQDDGKTLKIFIDKGIKADKP